MSRIRGRNLLCVFIALAITSACSDDPEESTAATSSTTENDSETSTTAPAALETETVTVMMFPTQVYRIPVLIADRQGFFAAGGIEIEETPQPTNLTGIQGLQATGADVGVVATSTLAQGWQAGADAAFFCGSQRYVETSLLAKVGSDLPAVSDGASPSEVHAALSNKTIGIQTPIGSGLHLFFQAAIEAEGVHDVTYVNTGVQPQVVTTALANGDVDIVQASTQLTAQLVTSGQAEELMFMPSDNAAYQQNYGSGFVASKTWLQENPELAARFCEAIDEANTFFRDDANAEVVDALLEEMGATPDVAARVRERSTDGLDVDIPEREFQATLDVFVGLGVLKPEPAPTYDELVFDLDT
ncbi:MAG: ABC transporter substrate-binding protein [Acidimicrobiia bacterium]